MNAVIVFALNSFKKSLKARSLFLVLFFALGLITFMLMANHGDVGTKHKLAIDAGLSLLKLFSIFMVFFNTLPLFPAEKEFRTLHAILAMNISRSQLIYGLFAGAILSLLVNFLLMTMIFFATTMAMGFAIPGNIFRSLFLLFQELAILTAFSLFFSIATTFLVGLMLSFFILIVGNMTVAINSFIQGTSGIYAQILGWVYYLMPNLALFDLKDAVIAKHAIPWTYDLAAFIYATSLCLILLCCSSWLLERQEIS